MSLGRLQFIAYFPSDISYLDLHRSGGEKRFPPSSFPLAFFSSGCVFFNEDDVKEFVVGISVFQEETSGGREKMVTSVTKILALPKEDDGEDAGAGRGHA